MGNHQALPRLRSLARWTARIWSIGVMLFALMLLLLSGVSLTTGSSLPLNELLGLGFSALALVGLVLAWRWEALGGALALVGAAVSTTVMITALDFSLENLLFPGLFTTGPGLLFLVSWLLSLKNARAGSLA